MLALTFFSLIFSSLLWLIFAVKFINDSLAGISFFDAGIANIMLYTLLVCLPIFLIWAVFGYVNQYINNKTVNLQLRKLMGQMKKNQDYSDLLARVLIETEQHINDGFILSKYDLLIADMNELLSEIIKGCKLASAEQIEHLWAKVQNGGKWSFGKVIIEINNSQPNFKKRIFEHAAANAILGGTIMEFCARYQAVVKMLENHDKDKLFLDITETGVMGKVFSLLSPIAAEIRRSRDDAEYMEPLPEPEEPLNAPIRRVAEEPSKPEERPSLLKKINLFGRKNTPEESEQEPEKDPFSIALERSFSDEPDEVEIPRLSVNFEDSYNDENTPTVSLPEEPEIPHESVFETEFNDTQKTIDELKKEWAEQSAAKEETTVQTKTEKSADEENFAYPFGSWTDENSYQK